MSGQAGIPLRHHLHNYYTECAYFALYWRNFVRARGRPQGYALIMMTLPPWNLLLRFPRYWHGRDIFPINTFRCPDITQVSVVIELGQAPLSLCSPAYNEHAFMPVCNGCVVNV